MLEFEKTYHSWYVSTADNIVILMFTLAFAAYLVAGQSDKVRVLISEYYGNLVALMILGNGALIIALAVLSWRERQILEISDQSHLVVFAWKALWLRIIFMIANIMIYWYAIWKVARALRDREVEEHG